MKSFYQDLFVVILFIFESCLGFQASIDVPSTHAHYQFQRLQAAKGFAGNKGFGGSKSPQQSKRPDKASVVKNLKRKYGGTTPEEVAKGTQRIIDKHLASLPLHLQEAIELYQLIQKWNYQTNLMSASPSSSLSEEQLNDLKRAEDELDELLEEHDLTTADLHNILQAATWDASADAKVARSMTGNMPADIQRRVQKGCDIVAGAIGVDGCLLDVGCGFGVMSPFLKKAGVSSSQIYGIDLSTEMIRNAEILYPKSNWTAGDFFAYQPIGVSFDAILFCSSLHDLPHPEKALEKAVSLLNPQGIIVVMHAQGASQVLNQVRSNPVLVQRGLPTAEELQSLTGVKLIAHPAPPNSQLESRDGYIAVLQKT